LRNPQILKINLELKPHFSFEWIILTINLSYKDKQEEIFNFLGKISYKMIGGYIYLKLVETLLGNKSNKSDNLTLASASTP